MSENEFEELLKQTKVRLDEIVEDFIGHQRHYYSLSPSDYDGVDLNDMVLFFMESF